MAYHIGAGQVIQQHVEAGVEQVLPALAQVAEQRVLVRQQTVVAGVELVDLGQCGVAAEQVGERGTVEPLPIQLPLAAGGKQAVGRQHEQHEIPARALAAGQQPVGPELIQVQLLPQMQRQPAGAPLPRPAQRQLRQPQPHDGGIRGQRLGTVLGEQRQRARLRGSVLQHCDRLAPGLGFAVVDLTEIQHRALHHSPARDAAAFHHAPVAVGLAVFVANRRAQEHDGPSLSTCAAGWE